jgi:hypothetical protein
MDKESVNQLQKEAEEAFVKLSLLKDAYYKAESDYLKKLSRFRNADYSLALIDGRLKKIPAQGERKEKKQPELTLDQIKGIAEKLGIQLTVTQEEVEEEVENEFE